MHDGTVRIQEDGSLAYFTIRHIQESPGRWQLGAIGHGPAGAQLATRIVGQIDAWDRDRTADPRLVAYPTDAPVSCPAEGKLIVKPQIRLYVRY